MTDCSSNSTSPTAIARATGYAPQTVRRALLGESRLFIVVPANSIMFDRAGRPRVKVGAVLVPSDPRGATYRVVDGGAKPIAGPEGLVARLDAAQAEVAAARDAIRATERDDSCDSCEVD